MSIPRPQSRYLKCIYCNNRRAKGRLTCLQCILKPTRLHSVTFPDTPKRPRMQQVPPYHSIYNHPKWVRLSRKFKRRNPFCARCLRNDRHVLAKLVDHIFSLRLLYEHKLLEPYAFEESNCQGLCQRCHNAKSTHERRGIYQDYRRGKTYVIEYGTNSTDIETAIGQALAT